MMSNQTSCFELPKIFGAIFQSGVAVFKLPTRWQRSSVKILNVKFESPNSASSLMGCGGSYGTARAGGARR